MEKIIEVCNLTQDYGHGRGVFDVSFYVQKGEVFGFLGPNGAGKSTTIRHIMGFSKPQSGETRLFGSETFKNYYNVLAHVGYLPGEIALPDGLTGWEFIRMMWDLRAATDRKKLDYLLDRFKLDPSGDTKKMSLGDKRKLAIVTAFMHDPDVLVLDEPTSGLDPVMQQTFIDFVKEEKSRGKTILLSSHVFNEVEATCDRIAIIKDGRIVSEFDSTDIKHNQNKDFEIVFKNPAEYQEFISSLPKLHKNAASISEPSIRRTDDASLKIIVAVNDHDINTLVEKLSRFTVQSFRQVKFTLEDYFMQFYREDKIFGGVFK